MVKMQIVTAINLEKLYDFTERKPEKASCRLLKQILDFYNINAKLIASINPDLEYTVICRDNDIEYVDVDIDTLLKDCEYVIQLNDGYEIAYACVE
jgi:hypothetical protein